MTLPNQIGTLVPHDCCQSAQGCQLHTELRDLIHDAAAAPDPNPLPKWLI
jgi:hypothetical protein